MNRRNFLRNLMGAAALVGLGPQLEAAVRMFPPDSARRGLCANPSIFLPYVEGQFPIMYFEDFIEREA